MRDMTKWMTLAAITAIIVAGPINAATDQQVTDRPEAEAAEKAEKDEAEKGPKIDPEAVARLAEQLGHKEFKQREKAQEALVAMGPAVVEVLDKLAEKTPFKDDPEIVHRIGTIIEKIKRNDKLAAVREKTLKLLKKAGKASIQGKAELVKVVPREKKEIYVGTHAIVKRYVHSPYYVLVRDALKLNLDALGQGRGLARNEAAKTTVPLHDPDDAEEIEKSLASYAKLSLRNEIRRLKDFIKRLKAFGYDVPPPADAKEVKEWKASYLPDDGVRGPS